MPVLAGVAQPYRLTLRIAEVGHLQDLRMARQLEVAQHMDLQGPPAPAEGDVLRGRDALVAEDQDVVVQVRAVQSREVGVVQRPRQVEPQHLGAKRRVEGLDLEGLRGRVGVFHERGGPRRRDGQGRGEGCHGRRL